jgi:hypothetical protein
VATALNGNVTNQFHDYLYHNCGYTLDVVTNGVPLPLVNRPNRFQTGIGDANQQPGWRYFTNTVVSYSHSQSTRAHFKATVSGEVYFASVPVLVPLGFDVTYAAASKPPPVSAGLSIHASGTDQPADVKRLRDEVQRLQRELTSKEQDLMELRSKVK